MTRGKTNIFYLVGLILVTIGPELQTEGATEIEWKIGRYARIAGTIMLAVKGFKPTRDKLPSEET